MSDPRSIAVHGVVQWSVPINEQFRTVVAEWREKSREIFGDEFSEVEDESGAMLPIRDPTIRSRFGFVSVYFGSDEVRLRLSVRDLRLVDEDLNADLEDKKYVEAGPVMDALVAHAKTQDAVNYTVSFDVPSADYACHVLPMRPANRARDPIFRITARGAVREQVGYKIDGGMCGITELAVIYDDDGVYSVHLIATGDVGLESAKLLPFVDELQNVVLEKLFEELGEEGC
mgnify:FL=1